MSTTPPDAGQLPAVVQGPEEANYNVRLAHDAKPVTVDGRINIGGHGTITLPSEEEQRRGFFLPVGEWTLLMAQYPRIYKPIQPKVAVPVATQQGQQANSGESEQTPPEGQPDPTNPQTQETPPPLGQQELLNPEEPGQGEEAQ